MGGDEIRRRLEMQGVTVAEFEEDAAPAPPARAARASLVTDGVMVSPASEAEQEFRRRNEQVKVEYVMVPRPQVSSVAVTDDEVQGALRRAARTRYAFPEQRVLPTCSLDAEALQPRVTVTDAISRPTTSSTRTSSRSRSRSAPATSW